MIKSSYAHFNIKRALHKRGCKSTPYHVNKFLAMTDIVKFQKGDRAFYSFIDWDMEVMYCQRFEYDYPYVMSYLYDDCLNIKIRKYLFYKAMFYSDKETLARVIYRIRELMKERNIKEGFKTCLHQVLTWYREGNALWLSDFFVKYECINQTLEPIKVSRFGPEPDLPTNPMLLKFKRRTEMEKMRALLKNK